MSLIGKKGLIGTAVGFAAAGAATAVAGRRIVTTRRRRRLDPMRDEPFGTVKGDDLTVLTDDGVALHVEIQRADVRRPSVIFVHGWALTGDSWHFQRRDLQGLARLVAYDQRGHGKSGKGEVSALSIERLGADLHQVIRAVTPGGEPVILAGHSLGGMTIMALAEQYPQMFGDQVVGVALIATSAKLSTIALGLPALPGSAVSASLPPLFAALGRVPRLVDHGRALSGEVTQWGMRLLGFGDEQTSPALVSFATRMISATPMDVIARLFPALRKHDRLAALGVLKRVATLVVAGGSDRLTPPEHAHALARALPSAELVTIPGAGHLVMLEQPEVVTRALRELIERVP